MSSHRNSPSRRAAVAAVGSGVILSALPAPLSALTTGQARSLIDRAVAEINAIINSGRPEASMYRDFEGIFRRYGDVPRIAQAALGPPARQASSAQMRAFSDAFSGYLSRKCGKRFREFVGS